MKNQSMKLLKSVETKIKSKISYLKKRKSKKTGGFVLSSTVLVADKTYNPIDLTGSSFDAMEALDPKTYTVCQELTKHCHRIGYLP
jgi:hypothetical protein